MAIKPTKRLISVRDAARPNLISTNLLSQDAINDEDCPWVEIGNLYVSVTIIGENSWLPLIARLHGRPESLRYDRKQYVVFTGRHGDIPNLVDHAGVTMGVFDRGHFTEDEAVKARALRAFPDVTIELVDAAAGAGNQSEWLKRETSRHIFKRKTVIYAWCYGIFTMCEAPSGIDARVLQSNNTFLISKTIGELSKTYWDWVPLPIR